MWIFLDIDGVLVPEKKFDQQVEAINLLQFDPVCLQKFEAVLHKYPQVRVVISSSWREVFEFEVVRPLFSSRIASRVVGFTPFLDPSLIHHYQYLRHQEVLEWLRQNQVQNQPWVAIDDIPEHYPPHIPVVATDAYHGFDDGAALALELFILEMSNIQTP